MLEPTKRPAVGERHQAERDHDEGLRRGLGEAAPDMVAQPPRAEHTALLDANSTVATTM